jgi:fructokinase
LNDYPIFFTFGIHFENLMAKKIVAFGEVVWDILPNEKILGGTPSNMAFRCNSFKEDGFLLSRVGDDELGNAALIRLNELGISDENVQVDYEFPTGTVKITLNEFNEANFHVTPDVAFDHIEFSAEALKLARNADCLFYGLLPQRFGISKNTLRELINESPDSVHFLDLKLFHHFFNVKVVEYLLECSHIVRIKEKEIEFLGRELGIDSNDIETFCSRLIANYKVDVVLITRGDAGVFAFDVNKGAFYDSGYEIQIEDNIGSGIAFCAGFLHYFLNGKSIQSSLNFGNAAGALNTTKRGATVFFNKKDVLAFIRNTSKK